ncbi:MAG: crossover junction endodeoxyribonuclease RuvC [Sandaracinaceae bacterium]|nr:crossover junction endodeoxyribonuclease RuvC [Sandaracinaceae bacterium]
MTSPHHSPSWNNCQNNYRLIGIDPGSHQLGWGVIEWRDHRFRAIGAGVIRLQGSDLSKRLLLAEEAIEEALQTYHPQVLVVEDVFHHRYPKATIHLAHVRGIVLLCAEKGGIKVFSYPPSVVKQTIGGRGNIGKEQLAKMVSTVLGLPTPLPPDAADALALALTHAISLPARHKMSFQKQVEEHSFG